MQIIIFCNKWKKQTVWVNTRWKRVNLFFNNLFTIFNERHIRGVDKKYLLGKEMKLEVKKIVRVGARQKKRGFHIHRAFSLCAFFIASSIPAGNETVSVTYSHSIYVINATDSSNNNNCSEMVQSTLFYANTT